MNVGDLREALMQYPTNIPIFSNSGWECGPTDIKIREDKLGGKLVCITLVQP